MTSGPGAGADGALDGAALIEGDADGVAVATVDDALGVGAARCPEAAVQAELAMETSATRTTPAARPRRRPSVTRTR
jgi:hypothetical protein